MTGLICKLFSEVTRGIFLQGDLVHQLKEKGAKEQELSRAVAELKARKKILEAKVRVSQLLVNLFLASFSSTFDLCNRIFTFNLKNHFLNHYAPSRSWLCSPKMTQWTE